MPIKSPQQQFLKSLRTRSPMGNSRSAVPPTVNTFRQLDFKLVWPAKLRDYVNNTSTTMQISRTTSDKPFYCGMAFDSDFVF
jgi:hypothetical protein